MATTAAHLIAYRKELIAGGIPLNLVADLVRDAARLDVDSRGLRVKQHDHRCACGETWPDGTLGCGHTLVGCTETAPQG